MSWRGETTVFPFLKQIGKAGWKPGDTYRRHLGGRVADPSK